MQMPFAVFFGLSVLELLIILLVLAVLGLAAVGVVLYVVVILPKRGGQQAPPELPGSRRDHGR